MNKLQCPACGGYHDQMYLCPTVSETKPVEGVRELVDKWVLDHVGKYESAMTSTIDLEKRITDYIEKVISARCAACKENK